MVAFSLPLDIVLPVVRESQTSGDVSLLSYLDALTYNFEHDGKRVSCVLIYAEPDPAREDIYHLVVAEDSGYEGVACVDDTARAVVLALSIYERTASPKALALARRWLTFIEYMQYGDGSFANFIRNGAGVRNATGATSRKGGYWWSARALWSLAKAYRITGNKQYLQRYQACHLEALQDGKINALLALNELELYQAKPDLALRRSILGHCGTIIACSEDNSYFRDVVGTSDIHFWGYHQLQAVARAARLLGEPELLVSCRETINTLVEPDVRAEMWMSYPDKSKEGVCAYAVSPVVQGLAEMYRSTGTKRYRDLALSAAAWFYGRNDARATMYEPTRGRCRDGISGGVASNNYGAESAIEAGLAELERRQLLPH